MSESPKVIYGWLQRWAMGCWHHCSKNTTPSLNALKNLHDTTIFLSSTPFHIPKLYLHIFAIYNDTHLTIYDYCIASSLTSLLLLTATSSLKRVGDCPERREIKLFYSDAGLPTLGNNRIISHSVTLCNIPLINAFHHSLDTLLHTNPLSFITGHWYSRRWVNARADEGYTPAVEAMFQATLTATQVVHKSLSECLLEDWRAAWCYVYRLCLPLRTYLLADKWLIV
jgi:hypothetical protein